jgi:hypothetical protein
LRNFRATTICCAQKSSIIAVLLLGLGSARAEERFALDSTTLQLGSLSIAFTTGEVIGSSQNAEAWKAALASGDAGRIAALDAREIRLFNLSHSDVVGDTTPRLANASEMTLSGLANGRIETAMLRSANITGHAVDFSADQIDIGGLALSDLLKNGTLKGSGWLDATQTIDITAPQLISGLPAFGLTISRAARASLAMPMRQPGQRVVEAKITDLQVAGPPVATLQNPLDMAVSATFTWKEASKTLSAVDGTLAIAQVGTLEWQGDISGLDAPALALAPGDAASAWLTAQLAGFRFVAPAKFASGFSQLLGLYQGKTEADVRSEVAALAPVMARSWFMAETAPQNGIALASYFSGNSTLEARQRSAGVPLFLLMTAESLAEFWKAADLQLKASQ